MHFTALTCRRGSWTTSSFFLKLRRQTAKRQASRRPCKCFIDRASLSMAFTRRMGQSRGYNMSITSSTFWYLVEEWDKRKNTTLFLPRKARFYSFFSRSICSTRSFFILSLKFDKDRVSYCRAVVKGPRKYLRTCHTDQFDARIFKNVKNSPNSHQHQSNMDHLARQWIFLHLHHEFTWTTCANMWRGKRDSWNMSFVIVCFYPPFRGVQM